MKTEQPDLLAGTTADREFTLVVVGASAVRCVYLNDYRVVGSKPYVSEGLPQREFKLKLSDIRSAIPELRPDLARENAELSARVKALESGLRALIEAYDWWSVDPVDRQAPGDEIEDARNLLKGEA